MVSPKMKQNGGYVSSMNSYNEKKNTFVRKQLLNTLMEMLKEKRIEDIVISDLIEKAGVGRVSFYRNYSSKEDILIQEERRLFQIWKWEPDHVYKASGRIVVYDQKVMLFFDFSNPNSWPYGSRAKG